MATRIAPTEKDRGSRNWLHHRCQTSSTAPTSSHSIACAERSILPHIILPSPKSFTQKNSIMTSNTITTNDPLLLSDYGIGSDPGEQLDLPPPPAKRVKLDASYYFQEEASEKDAVDFALQILQREHERYDPLRPSLEFSVAPHRGSIGLRSSEVVTQICATVKASELPADDSYARAPVDIVVALDVSGSMRVDKLDLCKKTLSLLLRELHHDDRFCLISFSDDARIEVPMLKVSDEQKLNAVHIIEQMQVRGRTNIASAISLAAEVANGVKDPNKVRSVFLLTDGNANVGITEENHLTDLTGIFVEDGHNPHSPPISLHTFGYGPEPDSKLLMSIARVTPGGSFYSVRDNSQIASSFGDAIGGILSVVAQQVILTISVPEDAAEIGAKIVTIHHDKKTEISDGVFQVAVGDMYAEETRDIIFEVSLVYPKTAGDDLPTLFPHAIVELSYFDTIKHTLIGPLTCTALIARPNNDDLSWPNCYVAIQWMRVRTAKVIADAWQLEQIGDLDRAKQKLSGWIEEFQKEKFEIGSDEPLLDQLLVDLTGCLDMLKKTNYDAYVENELGVRMQAHLSQRCSEPIGKRSVYRTAQKSLRAQAFERHV